MDLNRFDNIQASVRSAELMSEALIELGASEGTLLISDESEIITASDISSALDNLIHSIKATKRKSRICVVIYYCGHGTSDGHVFKQSLVPGDYNCHTQRVRTTLTYSHDSERYEKTEASVDHDYCIDLESIYKRLDREGIPYILLVDACYEGRSKLFIPTESTREVPSVWARTMTGYGGRPILFSSFPSKSISTVPNPRNKKSRNFIGPLCRRAILALDKMKAKGQERMLNHFVEYIVSPSLDSVSSIPFSTFDIDTFSKKRKKVKSAGKSTVATISLAYGSAKSCPSQVEIGCFEANSENMQLRKGVVKSSFSLDSLRSFFKVKSSEVIWDTYSWLPRESEMYMYQINSGHLEFCFRSATDTLKVVIANTSSSKFKEGKYFDTSASINDKTPCLNIKSSSNWCVEEGGTFIIEKIRYNQQGNVDILEMYFEKVCIDSLHFGSKNLSGELWFSKKSF